MSEDGVFSPLKDSESPTLRVSQISNFLSIQTQLFVDILADLINVVQPISPLFEAPCTGNILCSPEFGICVCHSLVDTEADEEGKGDCTLKYHPLIHVHCISLAKQGHVQTDYLRLFIT